VVKLLRMAAGFGALAGLLGACGSHHAANKAAATTTTTSSTTTAPVPAKCPLTDESPPGGRVPSRPALAVKVDNLPAARPQYGLAGADVVYEEPVEGGLTRFIVIYQCRDAARIMPIRSARIIDPEIVRQFGAHPLFGYAGGIQPAVDAVAASPLVDVGIYHAPPTAYRRDPTRTAPQNLYSSTSTLYEVGVARNAPQQAPPPVFTYGPLPPGAAPAGQVHIPYPFSDVTWTWESAAKTWSRSYGTSEPASQAEGGHVTAANVIVMTVVLFPSQYVEDPTGAHENLLTLTGSGPTRIFRGGSVVSGTWNRPTVTATTRYLDAAGHVIPLSPGTTWVELVPTTIATTVSP
jgi:hypothetical protein